VAIKPILMILYLCGVSCLVFILFFINHFIIGIQNRGGCKWSGMKCMYVFYWVHFNFIFSLDCFCNGFILLFGSLVNVSWFFLLIGFSNSNIAIKLLIELALGYWYMVYWDIGLGLQNEWMIGYWMDIGLSLVDIRVFHLYGYCCK
jgi:hypothetical protein